MDSIEKDNQSVNEDTKKKKVIGKGYRPPVATPLTLPYNLEINWNHRHLALHASDKKELNGIYVGDSKYAKVVGKNGRVFNAKRKYQAFVKLHKKGLIFVEKKNGSMYWKITFIPGELRFSKVVKILSVEVNKVKNIDEFIKNIPQEKDTIYIHQNHARLVNKINEIAVHAQARTREREIAGALLSTGL